MRKKKLPGFSLVLLGLVLSITLLSAAPADAVWPYKKCFCGFFDFNGNAFFGIPGIPYGNSFNDCFWIGAEASGNKGRFCSAAFGTCGTFEELSSEGSKNTWEGQIRGIPFFGGGRITVTLGVGERRGPGSVLAGTTMTKDQAFSPAVYYGGTVEGAEAPAAFCPLKAPPPA